MLFGNKRALFAGDLFFEVACIRVTMKIVPGRLEFTLEKKKNNRDILLLREKIRKKKTIERRTKK